jgi:hypothetical protein
MENAVKIYRDGLGGPPEENSLVSRKSVAFFAGCDSNFRDGLFLPTSDSAVRRGIDDDGSDKCKMRNKCKLNEAEPRAWQQ